MRLSDNLKNMATAFRDLVSPADRALRILDEQEIVSFDGMQDLAGRLGIDIEYVNTFPATTSGAVARDDYGKFVLINRLKNPVHREITLAHEIGNMVLHDPDQPMMETENQRMEANVFAMGLMMRNNFGVSMAELEKHNPDVENLFLSVIGVKALAEIASMASQIAACVEELFTIEPQDDAQKMSSIKDVVSGEAQ